METHRSTVVPIIIITPIMTTNTAAALTRISRVLVQEKETAFWAAYEDNVQIFRSNFGVRAFALRPPAAALMGICLDSDAINPESFDVTDSSLLNYARLDVGRPNTADNALQLKTWNEKHKVMLPDYLDFEDATTSEPLYKLEIDHLGPVDKCSKQNIGAVDSDSPVEKSTSQRGAPLSELVMARFPVTDPSPTQLAAASMVNAKQSTKANKNNAGKSEEAAVHMRWIAHQERKTEALEAEDSASSDDVETAQKRSSSTGFEKVRVRAITTKNPDGTRIIFKPVARLIFRLPEKTTKKQLKNNE